MSPAIFKSVIGLLLKAQVAAAEHIRDCDRCRRLFEVAIEEAAQSGNESLGSAFNPFQVTAHIRLELRACPDWPKGI